MSEYLTVEETAERLGVEYKTVYRLVRSGELPAGKVGRIYRIREDDLDAFFERQKQLVADKGSGDTPVAVQGLSCGSCGKKILSKLYIGGECPDCGRKICQACWSIRKIRRCSSHGEDKETEPVFSRSSDSPADREPDGRQEQENEEPDVEEIVQRLRDKGRPVVTAEEAGRMEETFIRCFGQRIGRIDELPDPLSEETLNLQDARVQHELEPEPTEDDDLPRNVSSRFTLSVGGWGRRKAGLVLEARFYCRRDVLKTQGYDAEPVTGAECEEILNDLAHEWPDDQCFGVVLVGSPTGWSEEAIQLITDPTSGKAFRDRRIGVGLYDLHADAAHLDETDERLFAFWPLLAPARYETQIELFMEGVREALAGQDSLALGDAAGRCGVNVMWMAEAFERLAKSNEFVLDELPEMGVVLSRARDS
jgi:excisionase family DNA binding protein